MSHKFARLVFTKRLIFWSGISREFPGMEKDFPGMTYGRFPGNFPPGNSREASLVNVMLILYEKAKEILLPMKLCHFKMSVDIIYKCY